MESKTSSYRERSNSSRAYILYGPAAQLVYTAGAGVDVFTLDRTLGEFILWKENVKMPAHGSTYAVNQANAGKWHEGARKSSRILLVAKTNELAIH